MKAQDVEKLTKIFAVVGTGLQKKHVASLVAYTPHMLTEASSQAQRNRGCRGCDSGGSSHGAILRVPASGPEREQYWAQGSRGI